MTDETDTDGDARTFLLGLLWSVLSIVVPAGLWALGVAPVLTGGLTVGSTVRFGTDLSLLLMGGEGDGFSQFSSRTLPVAVLMILVQFGTLGYGFWQMIGGSLFGIGIVTAMLASYLVGFLLFSYGMKRNVSDDDESEWEYSVNDL